jgi:hypothetical protein
MTGKFHTTTIAATSIAKKRRKDDYPDRPIDQADECESRRGH